MPDQINPAGGDPLLSAMVQRAQDAIQRKLMPLRAGDADPSTLRGAAAIQHDYPADMVNVRVKNMPWDNVMSISNILGYTPTKTGLPTADPETIYVSPAYGIAGSDDIVAQTIAHELEHVRQNRQRTPQESVTQFGEQATQPYLQRNDEKAAFAAADDWAKQHPERGFKDIPHEDAVFNELSIIGRPARDRYNALIRSLTGK